MNTLKKILFITILLLSATIRGQTIIQQIPLPTGYIRQPSDSGSFAYFLRHLPLARENIVYYYTGKKKQNQSSNYAVIDLDIGKRDLQQCADAVMRLWAEYLYHTGQYEKIYFNFLSDGKPHYYTHFVNGDYSYNKFRKYLNYVFAYANTSSLYDQLKPRKIEDMHIGNVFIQKGNPYGHAIIIVDMAINPVTGQKIFLLAQSFMPAQSIHILINPKDHTLSPWYRLDTGKKIETPDWTFFPTDLRSFHK